MSAAYDRLAKQRDEILSKYGLPDLSSEELSDTAREMTVDAKRLHELAEQLLSLEEDQAEFGDD